LRDHSTAASGQVHKDAPFEAIATAAATEAGSKQQAAAVADTFAA